MISAVKTFVRPKENQAMITLNDYLYSGDTIPKILMKYIADLRQDAKRTHNEIDLVHCNFLLQIKELLEHNDFLTAQSQQIREFYKYMAKEYPHPGLYLQRPHQIPDPRGRKIQRLHCRIYF